MTSRPDHFETLAPMLLAGRRRRYAFATAAAEIPRDWDAFMRSLPLPGQKGRVTYGAVCGADMGAGTFEYMPSVEVAAFEPIDPEFGRMRVPEARYAVFVHKGPIPSIRETIQAAHQWLETNGEWKDGETPEFERYGPDFDPATGSDVEIWVPIVPA